jgi:hypothetical protein
MSNSSQRRTYKDRKLKQEISNQEVGQRATDKGTSVTAEFSCTANQRIQLRAVILGQWMEYHKLLLTGMPPHDNSLAFNSAYVGIRYERPVATAKSASIDADEIGDLQWSCILISSNLWRRPRIV